MIFNNVFIHGFSYFEPDYFLSSDEMEQELLPVYKRLKLPSGRLELQTGIKRRGYYKNLKPSQIASESAKKCLNYSSITSDEIDLMIYAGVCRDMLEPSTASFIHQTLGLSNKCVSFDLSNACLGFLNALLIAATQIEMGLVSNALITTGENAYPLWQETKKFLNDDQSITRKSIKKYIANLTIGSMGVTYLLTSNSDKAKARLIGGTSLSNTSVSHLCLGDGNSSSLMMETDSTLLLDAGVKLANKTWHDFFSNIIKKTPDHVITHQVGSAHTDLLLRSLELDNESNYITYDLYGNTGSAAAPMSLVYHENKYNSDDTIAMLGIGSGLHSLMLGIKWF